MPDWILIDGSSLIFRAFFGVPQSVRAPDGTVVNAVRGFLDRLSSLIVERRPRRLAVASDEDWRPAWRVALIPSYKAHRMAEPIPPLLEPQMPIVHELLDAAGIPFVGVPEAEAEDVIATWVARLEGSDPAARVEVVSGDRDLFALIRDPAVTVLYPSRDGLVRMDEAAVERRYGVPGRRYADLALLRGDASDGLPGLPGVGEKRAAELVRNHGSVEGLLASGRLREADRDYLERACRVVLPVSDLPVDLPPRQDLLPADPERLDALGRRYGLEAAVGRLRAALPVLEG